MSSKPTTQTCSGTRVPRWRSRSRIPTAIRSLWATTAETPLAATYVSPALTTIQVPLDLLGRIAVDLLISPDSVPDVDRGMCRMAVSLVVRGSTGPATQTRRATTGADTADLRAL